DPARHHARVGDDPDDHRRRGAVRLHAHVAVSHPDARSSDRRDAREQVGADVHDQRVPAGVRILHPPAAIILMTSPILLPIITAGAGSAGVWCGVILTKKRECGLIPPPVGLNIYIVNAIAPDVPVTRVMWGTIPYVLCMFLAIVVLSFFPEIATWLPDHLMGPVMRK